MTHTLLHLRREERDVTLKPSSVTQGRSQGAMWLQPQHLYLLETVKTFLRHRFITIQDYKHLTFPRVH